MLSSREVKIMEILFRKRSFVTISELALELGVSSRTISSSISEIRKKCDTSVYTIESVPSKGIMLSYKLEYENQLEEIIEKGGSSTYSCEKYRKLSILRFLTSNNDYQTVDKIARSTFVSPSTIYRELEELEPFFLKYSLCLESTDKTGIKLVGEEKNLRIAKAELAKGLMRACLDQELVNELSPYFDTKRVNEVTQIVHQMQEHFNLEIPELSYRGLIIHLIITIDRYKRNRPMKLNTHELIHLKQQEQWHYAEYLIDLINEMLKISLDQNECGYVTIHLLGANITSQCENESSNSTLHTIDPELYDFTYRKIYEVSLRCGVDFHCDITLLNALFLHLKPMKNRLNYGITMNNPFLSDIKNENIFVFEIATYFVDQFCKHYKLRSNEDEIAYVAMHFGASLDRKKKQTVFKNVVLVCASGLGTSQFLKARLERECPHIKVISVESHFSIKNKRFLENIDYIISTIPLDIKNYKVIYIDQYLRKEDIYRIHERTFNIKDSMSFNKILSLVQDSIFKSNDGSCDFEQAISVMSDLLITNNYVDESFKESVLAREALSSTAIGNLIAIPHAFEGHVIKQAIGVMTLENPIDWQGNRVQLIFMIVFDHKMGRAFKEIFREISEISSNPKLIKQIVCADNYKEFVEILERGMLNETS